MSGQPDHPESGLREQDAAVEGQESENPVDDSDPSAADIDEVRARADENWDKYLRALAELENVRKRAARDVENARKYSIEPFARDLLAVRDSLEMGLTAAADADAAVLREGSEATLKLLASIMEQFGIATVDPQGEPFDPELHEAMMMQPSADAEPGSVLTVYQKGYSLQGRLLRPARVVVADAIPQQAPQSDDDAS